MHMIHTLENNMGGYTIPLVMLLIVVGGAVYIARTSRNITS